MCGLAGFATVEGAALNDEHRAARNRFFTALLWTMQSRGHQSTGLALCDTATGAVAVRKRVVSAAEFIQQEAYTKFLSQYPGANVFIGHTRLATMGQVSRRNAHPFHTGHVVGAHNGVVFNWRDVNKAVQVDSEVIFQLLDRHEDPTRAARELEGRFAVTWFDQRSRRVLLARGDNPLEVAYAPSLRTYFWASEVEPLVIAGLASGFALTHYDLPDDALLTLDLGADAATVTPLEWKRPVARPTRPLAGPAPADAASVSTQAPPKVEPGECWHCRELCAWDEEFQDYICQECALFERQFEGDPLCAYG